MSMEDPGAANLPPAVHRLRKLQIRCVIAGMCGALLLLVGMVLPALWLSYLGAAIFVIALTAIFVLGALALRTDRQIRAGQKQTSRAPGSQNVQHG